ncbi:unnamed protein product [Mortierella alpina]
MLHFSTCLGVKDLSLPRSCSVCGFKIETLKALHLHLKDCMSWPEVEEDFTELDAQRITKTGHPATARFVNDLFEQAEVTLPGGGKVYAYLPVGSSKRLGEGTEAYAHPMKRRSAKVIVDSKLELALRSHAYCSLVDIENYKVEVCGRRESEDAHYMTKLGEPDSSRSFKVANYTHNNTQMVIIGTVRWNALVTMAVVLTSGRVIVGPHNPWFHPHAASHVWLVKNGDEDLNNKFTRSKFDQASSYELFAKHGVKAVAVGGHTNKDLSTFSFAGATVTDLDHIVDASEKLRVTSALQRLLYTSVVSVGFCEVFSMNDTVPLEYNPARHIAAHRLDYTPETARNHDQLWAAVAEVGIEKGSDMC